MQNECHLVHSTKGQNRKKIPYAHPLSLRNTRHEAANIGQTHECIHIPHIHMIVDNGDNGFSRFNAWPFGSSPVT